MLTVNEIVVQADHVHCWSSEVGYQDVWEEFDSFFGGVENSILSHCAKVTLSINMVDFVKSVLDTELDEGISISKKYNLSWKQNSVLRFGFSIQIFSLPERDSDIII